MRSISCQQLRENSHTVDIRSYRGHRHQRFFSFPETRGEGACQRPSGQKVRDWTHLLEVFWFQNGSTELFCRSISQRPAFQIPDLLQQLNLGLVEIKL